MAGKVFKAGRRGNIECSFDDDGKFISRSQEVGSFTTMLLKALELPQVTGMIEADCPRSDSMKCEPCPKRQSEETVLVISPISGRTAQIVDDISNGVI